MRVHTLAIATLALLSGVSRSAQSQGSITFDVRQIGPDVVVTGSGIYDLTGATFLGTGFQEGFINPSLGLAVGTPFQPVDEYQLTANAGAFGPGGFRFASSLSGSVFGLDIVNLGGFITVPGGFTGGALSGTATFANETLASLGLTPGSYHYGIPNTSVTVNVGVVPEPSTVALLGGGLALIVAGARRRRVRARHA